LRGDVARHIGGCATTALPNGKAATLIASIARRRCAKAATRPRHARRIGRDEQRAACARHNSTSAASAAPSKVDQQIGLEPSWQTHVETMADVFDEVRRVLKPQGTLWLNYGDSYATSVNGRSAADTKAAGQRRSHVPRQAILDRRRRAQAERPLRHPVARRLRASGARLVAAAGHHLEQAEPDAGEHPGPLHEGSRISVPAGEERAVLFRSGSCD
jgi:hypothetical protein